jgi:hypothetical protein
MSATTTRTLTRQDYAEAATAYQSGLTSIKKVSNDEQQRTK